MTLSFYSSKSPQSEMVSLRDAVMQGQASDGGLFIPNQIPGVPQDLIQSLSQMKDVSIVEEISAIWLSGSVPDEIARKIARDAIDFPTPLVHLRESDFILELFHGPTLAFKDYGARFMARLLSYCLHEQEGKQTILVATSGDTGSAVAAGFLGLENIRVVVLYPSGRVSQLQEKQMTTLGHNVSALEVNGSFDDCQSLAKKAFNDGELRKTCRLNSANSINIARLIAQTLYYFIAYARAFRRDLDPLFSVPTGNLGNLTAGVLAKKMGLPVHQFIAATNKNDVFVEFLASGNYLPRASEHTISNAMDVGRPSNLERLRAIYNDDRSQMKKDIVAYATTDEQTRDMMRRVCDEHGYVLDPHTAVACHGLSRWRLNTKDDERPAIVLSTAHPGKFQTEVESAIGCQIALPPALSSLENRTKRVVMMDNDFDKFKRWLLET